MLRKNTAVPRWISAPLLCGALGVSACATAQPPVTVSHTEVITRETRAPLPPVELQSARTELDSARLAMDDREYERARRLADQAVVDARVAEARASTESMRQTAYDLRSASEVLREEAIRVSIALSSPPIELRLAKDELDNARIALDDREYERARHLAEQALADARLAELRAETENTRQTARDLSLSSENLRDTAVRLAALY